MHRNILFGVLPLCFPSVFLAAQNPELLTPVQSPPAASKAWDLQEKASNPWVVRSAFVRIDTASLMNLPMTGKAPLASYSLRLFGKSLTLDINESHTVLGYRVFEGRVRGRLGDTCLVVAPDQTTVYSTIYLLDESYVLAYAGHSNIHVLQAMDESRGNLRSIPMDPGPAAKASAAVGLPGGKQSSGGSSGPQSAGTRIDVAVFYTNRAMSSAGSRAAVEASIVTAMTKANRTCTNTSTPANFRLVLMSGVNYAEDGSTSDLGRFRATNDSIMDGVHAKRDAVGADLMHLITQPARLQYCGVGYLMNTNSTSFASAAFAVTVRSCISGNTVAHEMGHNIACHHDPQNAGGALFSHAYGFRTSDSRYRTTMSYSPGSRVEVWSNPALTYAGYKMGATNQDNNLTITKTRAAVSRFRATKDIEYRNIGGAINGSKGDPVLAGVGILTSNTVKPAITLSNYRAGAVGSLVIGITPVKIPFLGGTLIPSPDFVIPIPGRSNGAAITLDASALSASTLSNIWVQMLWLDAAAVQGVSATPGYRILLR